ncbi:MAG: hypothetical protein WA099_01885 [Sulfuricurvum sp.]
MKSFTLKKDETVRLLIKTTTAKKERILLWRWTLYTDKALVVHESFDQFVGQHILYVGLNDSFRKPLLPALKSERDVPYALVVFKKFDDKNQTAQFDFLLIDKEKRVLVDYLEKEVK